MQTMQQNNQFTDADGTRWRFVIDTETRAKATREGFDLNKLANSMPALGGIVENMPELVRLIETVATTNRPNAGTPDFYLRGGTTVLRAATLALMGALYNRWPNRWLIAAMAIAPKAIIIEMEGTSHE